MLYQKAEELKLNVAPANLTRLVYLSTFMDYDNRLVDDSRNALGINEPLDKQWMMQIMGLHKDTFYRFYNEVVEAGILIEQEDGYYLNEEFFKKGSLAKADVDGRMRFYRYGIRNLYLKAAIKDHKMLGYGFMVLPYVNVEYNILCWNPDEKNLDRVQPLDVTKMMEIFDCDLNHAARFKRQLLEVMVGRYQFMHLVDNERLFVSPNVYYAGNHRERVMVLGGFDVKRKK